MAQDLWNRGVKAAPLRSDGPRLPDGRYADQVLTLATVLTALGVPGASQEAGRAANVQAYADHLASIHKAAGDKAVADWLEAKRPKLVA